MTICGDDRAWLHTGERPDVWFAVNGAFRQGMLAGLVPVSVLYTRPEWHKHLRGRIDRDLLKGYKGEVLAPTAPRDFPHTVPDYPALNRRWAGLQFDNPLFVALALLMDSHKTILARGFNPPAAGMEKWRARADEMGVVIC